MSGHRRWSTIERHEGAADANRSTLRTEIVKEIAIAARLGGGDPAAHPRLCHALDDHEGVRNVHGVFEPSEAALAALG